MSEELKSSLAKLVNHLTDKVIQSEGFVIDQLPDLGKETLEQCRISAKASIIFSSFTFAILASIAISCATVLYVSDSLDSFKEFSLYIGLIVTTIFSFCFLEDIYNGFMELIYIKKTPKIVLIRELKATLRTE